MEEYFEAKEDMLRLFEPDLKVEEETQATSDRLAILRNVRGEVTLWPGNFGCDTPDAEIKADMTIQIAEALSRGFFV